MKDLLYAENSIIKCSEIVDIHIPLSYFETNIAYNKGMTIETFGIVYIQSYVDSIPSEIKMINIPTIIDLYVYSRKNNTIKIKDKSYDVITLQYLKDTPVMHQTFPQGREIANAFLNNMLAGKLPTTLSYEQLLDIWWTNLEMSGISFKVPSKVYEMIIASIYRNPNNTKQRFGQIYGKQENGNPYNYKTSSVKNVVKNLSTFSGIVFEDMNAMITNGINNNLNNSDEPESPLEKIIHY